MKALIFDMDGVIVDSEPMHTAVTIEVMQSYQVHFTTAEMDRFIGMSMRDFFSILKKEHALAAPVEAMIQRQIDGIYRHIKEDPQQPVPGILEILAYLKSRGIPAAIASSSPKILIEAIVARLQIADAFSLLLSGEDFPRSKPDPAIYLTAAEKLGVNPADCLVIEDSQNGTIAAKDAGMRCIGFQNPNSGQQDLSRADMIVPVLTNLDLTAF